MTHFEHESNQLESYQAFFIKGRWLYLYWEHSCPSSAPFSLYWQGEKEPIQRGDCAGRIFKTLSDLLPENDCLDK